MGVCSSTGKVENSPLHLDWTHHGQGDNMWKINPFLHPRLACSHGLHSDFNLAHLPKSHKLSPVHKLPYIIFQQTDD